MDKSSRKRCFARLPTGCERALGELNHKQHSEYNNKDTGWIDGGWDWNGTEDDCHNNRKKLLMITVKNQMQWLWWRE